MKTYYNFKGKYESGKQVTLVASNPDQAFDKFKDLSRKMNFGEIKKRNISCPFFK